MIVVKANVKMVARESETIGILVLEYIYIVNTRQSTASLVGLEFSHSNVISKEVPESQTSDTQPAV